MQLIVNFHKLCILCAGEQFKLKVLLISIGNGVAAVGIMRLSAG